MSAANISISAKRKVRGGTPKKAIKPLPARPAIIGDGSPLMLKLEELTGCKWPIGDPLKPDFGFCGQPRYDTHSYCHRHCQAAFQNFECEQVAA